MKRLTEEPGPRGEWAREVLSDESWAEPMPQAENAVWSSLRLALPLAAIPAPTTSSLGGPESKLESGGAGPSGIASAPPGAVASGAIAGSGVAAGSSALPLFSGATLAKTLIVSAFVVGGGVIGWQLGPVPSSAPAAPVTGAPLASAASPAAPELSSLASAAAPVRDPAPPSSRMSSADSRRSPTNAADDAASVPAAASVSLPVGVAALPSSAPNDQANARDAAAAASAAATGLLEESATLAAARSALRRGALTEATRHLDAHRSRFPGGRLVQEREALRIEVLHAAGRTRAAERELKDYARTYPGSPHASRLEQLLLDDGGVPIGK
ncbi:MAG: hypothetical protein JW751_13790 [Polyangiaceae bacterium]|nr:hypothetical protein [Polyangiaceae bacterium]